MKNQELNALLPLNALHYGFFVKEAVEFHKKSPNVLSPTQDEYLNFPSGYKLFANIQMTDFMGQTETPVYFGFMAFEILNPTHMVVAIRGTQSLMEWWDDFQIELTPCPFAPNAGNVETGFLDLYNSLQVLRPGSTGNPISLKETVSANLQGDLNMSAHSRVTLVGHSLGSSLATLYGLDMAAKNSNKEVAIYTLASPCVGDQDFVNYYHTVISESYRIYNEPDIVPKSLLLLGYHHVPAGIERNSLLHRRIKKSIACWHSLYTYLFLLGAPASILDPACTTLVQS
jgi:hypothetical protein